MIWKYSRKTPVFQCCFILISLWMIVSMFFHWNTIFFTCQVGKNRNVRWYTPLSRLWANTLLHVTGGEAHLCDPPAGTHTHSDPAVLFWECALKTDSAAGRFLTVPRRPAAWGLCSALLPSVSITWTWRQCQSLSHVRLLATPWTIPLQAPLAMGFSRQEYWSELPSPPSRGSSQSRDQTRVSHTAGRLFIIWATREAHPLSTSLN